MSSGKWWPSCLGLNVLTSLLFNFHKYLFFINLNLAILSFRLIVIWQLLVRYSVICLFRTLWLWHLPNFIMKNWTHFSLGMPYGLTDFCPFCFGLRSGNHNSIKPLWPCDGIVALWRHMATEIWVNIGSGNGLLPDGSKPLPEPVLTDHQLSPVTFILRQFHKICLNHQSLKSVWKLHVHI